MEPINQFKNFLKVNIEKTDSIEKSAKFYYNYELEQFQNDPVYKKFEDLNSEINLLDQKVYLEILKYYELDIGIYILEPFQYELFTLERLARYGLFMEINQPDSFYGDNDIWKNNRWYPNNSKLKIWENPLIF